MPTPSQETHDGDFIQAIRNVSLALRYCTATAHVYATARDEWYTVFLFPGYNSNVHSRDDV